MGKINLLDKLTIDQIAAGEVVERPASVVKELTENAIDAGASSITIEIGGGGVKLIRITDNGSGIPKEEVPTAFLRHATSKIKEAADLESVYSLGFRGEALPSIASVARVEMLTKTRGDFLGCRYVIEGGEEKQNLEAGCPEGTTIIVRDLFYNTPARYKFLKTEVTESGYIIEAVERLVLSHPEISFCYINKGRTLIHTTGNRKLKDVIYGVYGRDITAALIPAVSILGKIRVDGMIAKPFVSRGNRNFENYYVNGRYVKNQIITKAIEEAYKPYSMQHRFPFTALLIDVPSDTLDVNVHPAKLEVRFSDSELIYNAVYHAVSDALAGRNLIPDAMFEKEEAEPVKKEALKHASIEASEPEDKETAAKNKLKSVLLPQKDQYPKASDKEEADETANETDKIEEEVSLFRSHNTFKQPPLEAKMPFERTVFHEQKSEPVQAESVQEMSAIIKPELTELELNEKPSFRYIGQVFKTYLLIEWMDKFYIIDQHAAHEKVIYERLVRSFAAREVNSQEVFPSIVVSLTGKEEACLKQYNSVFTDAGFKIEHFGGGDYQITAVPCELFGMCGEDFFKELLDQMTNLSDTEGRTIILEKLATMACKAAIKGNMNISELEARKLVEELLTLNNPFNCPHGRPVIISMTKQELEKKFKRIV